MTLIKVDSSTIKATITGMGFEVNEIDLDQTENRGKGAVELEENSQPEKAGS